MNRNVESHFSRLPSVDIQRSTFDRSCQHSTSWNVGELVPLFVDDVLPGDTFTVDTSKIVRLQTLLSPVFGNAYLDTYWFYVPYRLCWSHWKEFCGENTQSAWIPETTYSIPKIKAPEGGFERGTIADYMGLPLYKDWSTGTKIPSALPFRAYALICNEFFRDQNLTDPLNISTGDSYQQGSNGSDYINDVANGGKPFIAAKYHDYFTSCLPSSQKGTSPLIPVGGLFHGGDFPVYTREDTFNTTAVGLKMNGFSTSGTERISDSTVFKGTSGDYVLTKTGTIQAGDNVLAPSNLYAAVPDQDIGTGTFSVNALRLAFAAQRFLEKSARSGSRYIETLAGHFGVTSPDARLQRPEYLGGNRVPLSVSQVTNTAQTNNDYLGDVGAQSVTADQHSDFTKSFTEHGVIMCLACVRYDHIYSQGLERFWMVDNMYDMYWPTFSNLGEMPVYTNELWFDKDSQDTVFGYQEAWSWYRYKPNRVSGYLRPDVPQALSSWTFADNYSEAPTLSDAWIREDKNNVDRALAVTSDATDQIFADFYFNCKCTRPMPMYSVPGLIDHN